MINDLISKNELLNDQKIDFSPKKTKINTIPNYNKVQCKSSATVSDNTIYTLTENNYVTNWIKKFNTELSPIYNIYTYFSDPYKSYIVYLFIETNRQLLLNLKNATNQQNQITPFTCNIEDEFDKTKIKIKLYEINSNNNLIYDICFDIKKYQITNQNFDLGRPASVLFNVIFNLCYVDFIELICFFFESGKIFKYDMESFIVYLDPYYNKRPVLENLQDFFKRADCYFNGSSNKNRMSEPFFNQIDIERNLCTENDFQFIENFENYLFDENSKNFKFAKNNLNNSNFSDESFFMNCEINDIDTNKIRDIDLIKKSPGEINDIKNIHSNVESDIDLTQIKCAHFTIKKSEAVSSSNCIKISTNFEASTVSPHKIKNSNSIDESFFNTLKSETQQNYKNETEKTIKISLTNIKKLQTYIQSWTILHYYFFNASLAEKLDYIKKLSDKIYYTCRRYSIKPNDFKQFTLDKIKNIDDKLDKLTLFFIFTKLSKFADSNNPKCRYCDLFVLSWIYLNYKPQNDIEKRDLVLVVYFTTRNKNFPFNGLFVKHNVSSLQITMVDCMKLNFINRVLLIQFNEHRIFSYGSVNVWQLQLLWKFLVYIVEIKRKLFDF